MPLQSAGEIRASEVNTEFGLPFDTEHPFDDSHTGLGNFSSLNNSQNSNRPDGNVPHSLSEFYDYNHNYNPQNVQNVQQQQNIVQNIVQVYSQATVQNTCVVAGQTVRLNTGLKIQIDRIQPGDLLLGVGIKDMPMDHNVTDEWKITKLDSVATYTQPVRVISADKGVHDRYFEVNKGANKNINLKLTQEHPLFIRRKIDEKYEHKWMRVDEVKVGDHMLRAHVMDPKFRAFKQCNDADWTLIETIDIVKGEITAYALDVDGTDTYIVGDIVVHNGPNVGKGGGGPIDDIGFENNGFAINQGGNIEAENADSLTGGKFG
tara:strand:- start:32 stop:988 length:957 start_codon:yes stop_codon:yes gene_type:complete